MTVIQNEETRPEDIKNTKGIGLYKINYEMDVKSEAKGQNYTAGVIAYSSDEAVQTLVNFAQSKVEGFKGLKLNEVSFDGLCHAMSDEVKGAILNTAKNEGIVISKEDHELAMTAKTEDKKDTKKKSVIKKSK